MNDHNNYSKLSGNSINFISTLHYSNLEIGEVEKEEKKQKKKSAKCSDIIYDKQGYFLFFSFLA